MNKKWMAGVLSAMILGSAIAGAVNHPAFAAAPEKAKKVIAQHINKDQEQEDNDREVADSVKQANLAKMAKITQQQSIDIATKKVVGTIVKSELEDEDGVVVYNVKIKDNNGQENEVKVDAKTGSIVKVENDDQNDNDTETNDDANG